MKYEPQIENFIPLNFLVAHFIPFYIDQFVFAQPSVIADSRRKPKEYESLAQPFKKDRRFEHTFSEEDQSWKVSEVNP